MCEMVLNLCVIAASSHTESAIYYELVFDIFGACKAGFQIIRFLYWNFSWRQKRKMRRAKQKLSEMQTELLHKREISSRNKM